MSAAAIVQICEEVREEAAPEKVKIPAVLTSPVQFNSAFGKDIIPRKTVKTREIGHVWSATKEFGHRFGAGADLQFFVDTADVGVYGFVADAHFFRDFLVKKSMA